MLLVGSTADAGVGDIICCDRRLDDGSLRRE